ncbi:class I SAM-dependent methyltransferase [Cohnella kolymensis]|uniref:class I SAM-dependent methyltransferase n=1 Tax=Cohnella kolymensis TaxID=1590652 RepID=UPI001F1BDC32|nr:methyltransferase domain-containing protein [Cohnella kolymensis]
MTINFGNVSDDYAKYRDHLPVILFDQLKDRGINFYGLNVIDLGSGSGIFSRDLAIQGANVIGIEPSSELIKEALRLDHLSGISSNKYFQAKAEEFTLNDTYPVFTAVRSWHWFERNRTIQNIKKIFRTQGVPNCY